MNYEEGLGRRPELLWTDGGYGNIKIHHDEFADLSITITLRYAMLCRCVYKGLGGGGGVSAIVHRARLAAPTTMRNGMRFGLGEYVVTNIPK